MPDRPYLRGLSPHCKIDRLVARRLSRKPVNAGWTHGIHGNFAGDENGLDASTTNITSACRSVVPLLETCIGVSAPWPVSALPAPTRITPWGVWLLGPAGSSATFFSAKGLTTSCCAVD